MKRTDQHRDRGARVRGRVPTPSGQLALDSAPQTDSLEWLYWLIALWSGTLMVLPYDPAKFLLFGIFWIVFGWVLINIPRYLPLMVILGLPAMVFAPSSARARIPLVNNHTYFLVGLVVAVFLVHRRSTKERPPNLVMWAPIFLAIVVAASVVKSHLTGAAMWHTWERGWHPISFFTLTSNAKAVILFPFLAPIAFRLLSTREHMRRTVHIVAISTLLLSLEDIWGLRHAIIAGAVGAYNRAGGFIHEPNAFGGYLAIMIAVIVPLFLDGKLSKRERMLFATTLGAASTALLFTLSRGSWLALIVAMGYLAFARGLKAMVFVTVIVLTATIWLPQSVIDRVRETVTVDDGSIQTPFEEEEISLDGSAGGRIEHWTALIDQWAAAPILGHGFSSYGRLYGHIRKRTGAPVAAHSTIVEYTAEEGLLGLIAYAWLIWAVSMGARGILRLGQLPDDDGFLPALALGMTAATICLIVLDSSGARMKNPLVMSNMWILGGGMARQYWNQRQIVRAAEREQARQKTRRRRSKSRVVSGQPASRPV